MIKVSSVLVWVLLQPPVVLLDHNDGLGFALFLGSALLRQRVCGFVAWYIAENPLQHDCGLCTRGSWLMTGHSNLCLAVCKAGRTELDSLKSATLLEKNGLC